ncbi:hypothetical protein FOZ63_000904 [Perkinsus olseni]|uniref:Uncharacterized protein n=1 Tax=Perkinsus olseni TaxID=32597 RepID=A0A7J6TVT6_PEROL|nr:hypothetical protein FOZ63_000904 [Perkinsus olseni]
MADTPKEMPPVVVYPPNTVLWYKSPDLSAKLDIPATIPLTDTPTEAAVRARLWRQISNTESWRDSLPSLGAVMQLGSTLLPLWSSRSGSNGLPPSIMSRESPTRDRSSFLLDIPDVGNPFDDDFSPQTTTEGPSSPSGPDVQVFGLDDELSCPLCGDATVAKVSMNRQAALLKAAEEAQVPSTALPFVSACRTSSALSFRKPGH